MSENSEKWSSKEPKATSSNCFVQPADQVQVLSICTEGQYYSKRYNTPTVEVSLCLV